MKKIYSLCSALSCIVFINLLFSVTNLRAQGCVNADFSDGDFTGWTGTYWNACTGGSLFGICICSATNPLSIAGINQGPNDASAALTTHEWNQVITTAGNNDPNALSLGTSLPTVYPGGNAYSARL